MLWDEIRDDRLADLIGFIIKPFNEIVSKLFTLFPTKIKRCFNGLLCSVALSIGNQFFLYCVNKLRHGIDKYL
jgi:hypothetical protein